MPEYPTIIKKRIGFLAATAIGLSAVLVTCIVCGTVMFVYGLHVASDKADGLFSLAERTVQGLPDMARALPPALCDLLDDQRRPDYAPQIAVSGRLFEGAPGEAPRVVVEAANNGDQMVTLLSLRVTVVDNDGRLLWEANEWAASPFAADGPWRGPLMAGANRRFNTCGWFHNHAGGIEGLKADVEITDIRVWNGAATDTPQLPEALAEEPPAAPPTAAAQM